jgi:hypothetical protein
LKPLIDAAKSRRGVNTITAMHLDDLSARIKEALDPKS